MLTNLHNKYVASTTYKAIKRALIIQLFEELIEKITQIVTKHQTCDTSWMLSHNLSYFARAHFIEVLL